MFGDVFCVFVPLSLVVLVCSVVADQDVPDGCLFENGEICQNISHAICDPYLPYYDALHATRSHEEYCLCEWDYQWVSSDEKCHGLCDESHCSSQLINTEGGPIWNYLESGWRTQDTLKLALKVSKCTLKVSYLFGEYSTSYWSDLNDWEEYDQSEDCYTNWFQEFKWYEDKYSKLHAIPDPSSPVMASSLSNGSLVRLPTDEAFTSQHDNLLFMVYDIRLYFRQLQSLEVTLHGRTYSRDRSIDSILQFKVLFPTLLQVSTNVSVAVVETVQLLFNETVVCTDEGGFAAYLEFETYTIYPYYLADNWTVNFSGDHNCFRIENTYSDNSNCEDPTAGLSPGGEIPDCVQMYHIEISLKDDGGCDQICSISGVYGFTSTIVNFDSYTDDHPYFNPINTFNMTVQSANFCPQVVAEAAVSGSMSAYQDAARYIDDSMYLPESVVYLKAEFSSMEAVIHEVHPVQFAAYYQGVEKVLYNEEGNTALGSTTGFKFDNYLQNDMNTQFMNPYYMFPEFNMSEEAFRFDFRSQPVVVELRFDVYIAFEGNENDFLLEMHDQTEQKFVHCSREIIFFPTLLSTDESPTNIIDGISGENAQHHATSSFSAYKIATITLSLFVLVGIVAGALFLINYKKERYHKVNTKMSVISTS